MRRHVFAAIVIFLLAVIESSLLPAALGNLPRPNLVLIVSSVWATLRSEEGPIWAMLGGVLLDLQSGAPFGIHTLGLTAGNLIALLLDRAPFLAPVVRAIGWTTATTVVYYSTALAVLAFVGQPYDVTTGFTNVVLPSLAVNALLAIPTYLVLGRFQARLREQERFLPER